MHRALPCSLSALGLLAACTGTPASTLGTTASSSSSGVGGATASSVSTSGVGGQRTRLADEGLLARYYLDTSDAAPTVVEDAGPEGLDLPVVQSGNLSFGGEPGRRGMTWSAPGDVDAARQVDASPRIAAAYDGAETLTYETVVMVDASVAAGGSIVHFGSENAAGTFSLHTTSGAELGIALEDDVVAVYLWPFATHGRSVLHTVLDLAAPEGDRLRLYANGRRLAPHYFIPTTSVTLTSLASDRLWLGNREGQSRSFEGTLGYAAIYERALDEDTIANHVRILLEDDDQP